MAHTEIDLANPKTNRKNAGFTDEEREGFNALLQAGFIDCYRHFNPEKKKPTLGGPTEPVLENETSVGVSIIFASLKV